MIATVVWIGVAFSDAHVDGDNASIPPPTKPSIEDARRVVERFYAVERWQEMLPLVRNPQIVQPLMEEW